MSSKYKKHVSHHISSFPPPPPRFDFLLWCLCGACHTPTPQQRRLLLASSSVSSVSKSSRAATLPVPALTPARSPAPLTWWRWPSPRPSRLTCHRVTAPTAASTAGHTWPITTSSSQRYSCPNTGLLLIQWSFTYTGKAAGYFYLNALVLRCHTENSIHVRDNWNTC